MVKHLPLDSELPVEKATSFVGRTKDLVLLHDNSINVITIVGISGVGKTSLVRKFVEEHCEEENVITFWHTFKEIDTLSYLIGRIAVFLSATNDEDLIKHLDTSKIRPIHESDTISIATKALFRINKSQFIFDDYHKVRDEKISFFMKHLLETQQRQSKSVSKILIISRTKLPFFLDKINSREIILSGLSFSDATKMISELGLDLDGSNRKELHTKFGGHPMALKIYCSLVKEHIGDPYLNPVQ